MNKSWVALYRFGSALAFASLTASAQPQVAERTPPAHTEEIPVAAEDMEAWLKRSRKILEESSNSAKPDWLRNKPDQKAVDFAEQIAARARPEAQADKPMPAGRVFIFGSLTLPEPTLRALLEDATEPNVIFVLRGVPKDGKIKDTIAFLKRFSPRTPGASETEQRVPQVILDPTLFKRYGVSEVPTLVLTRDKQPPVTVRGAVSVSWFKRMAANVAPGTENLGRRAESYPIGEPDLILELQRRMANVDWNARRDAALKNFWKKQPAFVDLPATRERREFTVDPSVRVTEDLHDADGKLLVAAGTTFNPLAQVPLSKTIIVFRATDVRQVRVAAEAARLAQRNGRGIILLTTDLDTTRGWEHLSELERQLAGTVYLLPSSLVERFHLTRVPATVVARGQQLVVTELPVGAG